MALVHAKVPHGVDNGDASVKPKVLVGLLGAGISGSRTPRMHEQEGAHLGLDYTYQLLDTRIEPRASATPDEIVRAAQLCGFAGINVTYPFKQAVLPFIDQLSDNAARVGAVNTIVFREEVLRGHNTDLWGYKEGFLRNMSGAKIDRVALLGAGGAGGAVAHALLQIGVKELSIVDVDDTKAQALVERLSAEYVGCVVRQAALSDLDQIVLDGLVNATPIGMETSPGTPVDVAMLRPEMWVSDIIYFPLETELLRQARLRGCRTMSGAPMAVFQAVRAFELFSGVKPNETRMRETFDAF